MKRFMIMITLLVLCVSVASAELPQGALEKMNRYFFRTGIIIKNNNLDYAVCVDYTGAKWKVPNGKDWRKGEVCTLWLYTNKLETGVYWASHGGFTNVKEWATDTNAFEEKYFDLITDENYYPINYYAVTMVVTGGGVAVDCDGKKWHLPENCTFAVDDVLTCMVWNNGTNNMKNDNIVMVTYSGHAENFFKNF